MFLYSECGEGVVFRVLCPQNEIDSKICSVRWLKLQTKLMRFFLKKKK